MKRILCLAAAALALCGCSLKDSYSYYRTESRVVNFSEELANLVTNCCVIAVSDVASGELKGGMFADGFSTSVIVSDGDDYYPYGEFLVTRKAGVDSTWTVTPSGSGWKNKNTFETTVRMRADGSFGLHQWECSGSGVYDEGNGYTATASSDGAIKYTWEVEKSSTTAKESLVANGKINCSTLYNGRTIENCTIIYNSTYLGPRYQRSFRHILN